ncbi:MAG: hypothetical protein HC923_02595 [Myxococcales bacterium]|nr:hypothetical protein [Myxococcales bacterium]
MNGLFGALFLVGSLAAAYALVEQPQGLRWTFFGGSLLLALVGIIGRRMQRTREALRVANTSSSEAEPVGAALARVIGRVDDALNQREAMGVRLMADIDRHLKPELRSIEAQLAALSARLGVKAYARFMDGYARGERALYRAWAAAADGYSGEARRCLGDAALGFRDARRDLGVAPSDLP